MASVGSRGRTQVPGYIATPYKERELRGAEKTLFDLQMGAYNKSYQEKFPEVTREQYAQAVKKTIIAPQYAREKAYNERMISMLEAGTDLRAASKQAATAAKAETVASQIKQQTKMSAISKASGSQFGAQALAAGMTGATPTSTGSSLITPEIVKSVSAPKVTPKAKVAVAASETAADTAVEKIQKEIETQQALAPIRQRRRTQAQAQASLLRRGTGRGALLSSPAGGAGFFSGYFKG